MKFEEGSWYQFKIDGITTIPDKGEHFILLHDSGRKMLLNAQYYVKYKFCVGDTIECRVDKVNCTGNVFLEPKHPFYIEGYTYNFEVISCIPNDDSTISISVKDYFNNSIQLIANQGSIKSTDFIIRLKVDKVKKGVPILSFTDIYKLSADYRKGQKINLKVTSSITLNSEDYYLLADSDHVISKLKVKHFKSYGFSIGKQVTCEVRGFDSNGLLIVEPVNPWYKIGESYFFKKFSVEEFVDLKGDKVKSLIVVDVNGSKCGVKIDSNDIFLSGSALVKCRVIGYRKGRPQLEIDPN